MKIFDYNFLLLLGISIIVYFIYRDVEDLKYKINAIEKSIVEPTQQTENTQIIELPLPQQQVQEQEQVEQIIEKTSEKINIILNESCTVSDDRRHLLQNNVEIYSNDAEILGTDNTILESAKNHMIEKPIVKKIKVDSISLQLKEINSNKINQHNNDNQINIDIGKEIIVEEKPEKKEELKEELQDFLNAQTSEKIESKINYESDTEKENSTENNNIDDETDDRLEKTSDSEWNNPDFLSKFKKNKLAFIQAQAEKNGISLYKTSKNGKNKKKKKDELISEIISVKKLSI